MYIEKIWQNICQDIVRKKTERIIKKIKNQFKDKEPIYGEYSDMCANVNNQN